MATAQTNWQDQINLGIEWRQRTSGSNDQAFTNYANYYAGNWAEVYTALNEGQHKVTVNRAFAYIRSLAPLVFFTNPSISIDWANAMAQTLEDVDNVLMRIMQMKRILRAIVLDGLLYGVGIVKIGYSSLYSITELEEGNQNVDSSGKRIEYSSRIRPGYPWLTRVDPTRFVLPYGSLHIDDSPWCAELITRPVEDVKNDKAYNSERMNVQASHSLRQEAPKDSGKFGGLFKKRKPKHSKHPELSDGSRSGDGNIEMVKLWEIRNYATGQMIVVADGSQKELYKEDDPLISNGFVHKMLKFHEDPKSVWGVSTLKIMEPQLLELNSLRSHQHYGRRMILRKLIINKQMLADPEIDIEELLNANEMMNAIEVNGDPRLAVHEMTNSLPQEFFQVGAMIDDDLQRDVGLGRNQSSQLAKGRRTATEVGLVQEAFDVGVSEKRDNVVDLIQSIMRTVNDVIFELWDDPQRIQKLIGTEKTVIWNPPTEIDSTPNYVIRINPEDAGPINSAITKQVAMEKFQLTANDPYFDPFNAREDLSEAFGDDPKKAINPQLAQVSMMLIQSPELLKVFVQMFQKLEAEKESEDGGSNA